MAPVVEVSKLAHLPEARHGLEHGRLVFDVGEKDVEVSVAPVPMLLATKLWLLSCPACQRMCRLLFAAGKAGLCCGRCAGIRHPDQRTSGSERGRLQRCAQQIRRLEARLARRGPDRTTRRRLRRRWQRLLRHLAGVLACRQARTRSSLVMVPTAGVGIH
jgi:hypothetical protein